MGLCEYERTGVDNLSRNTRRAHVFYLDKNIQDNIEKNVDFINLMN